MEIKDFISKLLFSRNQAHVYHWQTKSYAKHIALETYYNNIVDLIDSIVETHQGVNDIIKMFSNNDKYGYGEETIIPYFEELLTYITTNRNCVSTDSDMQNIVDEIVSLIKNTLYRLKNLN